jgi:uncharacterized repeat protein (TIGR02543 family)
VSALKVNDPNWTLYVDHKDRDTDAWVVPDATDTDASGQVFPVIGAYPGSLPAYTPDERGEVHGIQVQGCAFRVYAKNLSGKAATAETLEVTIGKAGAEGKCSLQFLLGILATFDYQGGSVNPSVVSKYVKLNTSYGTLPTPTHAPYTFGGWYTQMVGGGTLVTSASIASFVGTQTLYAKWTV